MRNRILTRGAALALAVVGLAACGAEADPTTGDSNDAIVAGAGLLAPSNIWFWNAAPIAWTGCAATLGIGVFATAPLNFLAFNAASAQNLALTLSMVDGFGVVTPLPNIVAMPINTALLGTIQAGLAANPLLLPAITAPAIAPFDVTLLPLSMQTNLAALLGTTTSNVAAMQAALQLAMTPAIADGALVFTGLPTLAPGSFFMVNAAFDGLATAPIVNLSAFGALAAQNAVLQSSILNFPIMPGCAAPIAPLAPIAPIVGPVVL